MSWWCFTPHWDLNGLMSNWSFADTVWWKHWRKVEVTIWLADFNVSFFPVWKQRHVHKVLNTYEDEIITGFVNIDEWHQIFERFSHTFPLAYSALFFLFMSELSHFRKKKFQMTEGSIYWGHLFQMNLLLNDVSKQTVSGRFTCQSDPLFRCFLAKIRITLVWKN